MRMDLDVPKRTCLDKCKCAGRKVVWLILEQLDDYQPTDLAA